MAEPEETTDTDLPREPAPPAPPDDEHPARLQHDLDVANDCPPGRPDELPGLPPD